MSPPTTSTVVERRGAGSHGATTGTTSTVPARRVEPPPRRTDGPRRTTDLLMAVVLAIAVIAALVAVVAWPDRRADDVTSPTTTTGELATEATEPTTTAPAPGISPDDSTTAVFPSTAGGARFTDPVEAVRAFAVELVGFTDPLVGEWVPTDARSGEVLVRPTAHGPATTVFVSRLSPDGSWWVLGAATGDITVDAPRSGDAVTSPVTVVGSALAPDRTVVMEVRQDGTPEPLGDGFVSGGGNSVRRSFWGRISFDPPTVDHGALLFLARSADDDRVWEATVIPVRFP